MALDFRSGHAISRRSGRQGGDGLERRKNSGFLVPAECRDAQSHFVIRVGKAAVWVEGEMAGATAGRHFGRRRIGWHKRSLFRLEGKCPNAVGSEITDINEAVLRIRVDRVRVRLLLAHWIRA